MSEYLLDKISPFVEIAMKQGANEVELFAVHQDDKSVNLETNELKSAVAGILQGVGIRVLVNKSLGFVAVNSLEKSKLEEGLRDAISIAKVTPAMDHYSLPIPKKIDSIKNLFDESVSNISMDEVIQYGNDLLTVTKGMDPRISIQSGAFSASVLTKAIVSSTGIEVSEKKSNLTWQIWGWAVDGEDIGSFEAELNSVVRTTDVDIHDTAESFAKKALQNLGAIKTDPFKGTAVLSPYALLDLFHIIAVAASATEIQSGQSYLQDRLGEEIAVEELSISDDGTLPSSVSSSSFDREGHPHTGLEIIDKGVFKGILYNVFSANKAGLQSTGHAGGIFRTTPNIAPTNLEVHAGNQSLDEIFEELNHAVYIQRVSASPDYTSGNFSAVVKGGRLIEKGSLTKTLKEITAVGNIFEGLKNISAISKEQKHIRSPDICWLIPYIRMDNLDFAT
ncbi:MAG: TldD/PmbA family protein [Candidatus Thorarchaeota archaeon]